MTREQAKGMLGENATDEQITALLNQFHSEQKNLQDEITGLKSKVTTLTTDNTNLLASKQELDELKKANMTEQERLEAERKALAAERKATALERNTAKAKTILANSGMDEASLDEIIKTIVREDDAVTLANATLLANQFKGLKERTAKQTKEDLASVDVKPSATNIPQNAEKMTWDKYVSMPAGEQEKFRKENPDEFLKL